MYRNLTVTSYFRNRMENIFDFQISILRKWQFKFNKKKFI